jgi:heptosyltransferase II
MNILVIRLSSMGDVVLATSVFSYLKDSVPAARIWFLTDAMYAGLFASDPRLHRVVGLVKGGERDAAVELSREQWDRVIDLQNNGRSARVRGALSVHGPVTVFHKLHRERFFLLFTRLDFYDRSNHVIARYAKAAGAAEKDIGKFPSAKILLDKGACACAGRFLPNKSIVRPSIAFFPFSAWKNKEWPRHYYGYVGRFFTVKGWNVFIFGGPQDAMAGAELKHRIGERCISMAGKLSLYECACLISRCRLALGNDTGLSHLARACGVKTGIIYGPTTAHFGFFPYGDPPYRVFETRLLCRPCHAHGGTICLTGTRPCMTRVRPESVIEELERLHHGRHE